MATQNSIDNTSNPIASTAVTVDPGASGDSAVAFEINGAPEFITGVDDTDSDAFVISSGATIGTNNRFRMSASGERTLPLQPLFYARPNANKTNVTGDGTVYTVVFDNEITDAGGDFDGTSTFTAPIAGKYWFYGRFNLFDVTGSTRDALCEFNVNSGTLYPFYEATVGAYDAGGTSSFQGGLVLSLAASDTVTVQVTSSGGGGTKIVDVRTGSSFSAFLMV